MPLKIYNSLTHSPEEFVPIQDGKVSMYTCGPTVYNYAHIGNFRAYIFEDLLRRTLKYCGYSVHQVMNLTDVDDKTIRDSIAAGLSLDTFTAKFKSSFFEDIETLRIEKAEEYPAATDHISEMIALILTLIDKGVGYVGDDKSVYFAINQFPNYGQLANIDLNEQRPGERVQADEYGKESVADFALWKHWNEDDGDVYWESPWGRGRPGWHIECSAMSMKYLGNHFDIHTGGIDNMFPHHEDEIAQSQAATGEKFVNYWLHCGHLIVDGAKMSKSSGNFFTLRDLLDKGYTGREIRWCLLAGHYRQQLNFTFDGLDAARTVLQRIDDFLRRLRELANEPDNGLDRAKSITAASESSFREGLEDDLNISLAIAALFDCMRETNKSIDNREISGDAASCILDYCRSLDVVFGLLDVDGAETAVPREIQDLVDERLAARTARDFARADELRDKIHAAGWRIEDTPKGTRVRI